METNIATEAQIEQIRKRAVDRAASLVRNPKLTAKSLAALRTIVSTGVVLVANGNSDLGRSLHNLIKRGFVVAMQTERGTMYRATISGIEVATK